MNENEDRLLEALRSNFANRVEIAEMKHEMVEMLRDTLEEATEEFRGAVTRIKEGNGAPGLYPLQSQIETLKKEMEPLKSARSNMSRLRWAVATSAVTTVAVLAVQWAMVNKVTAPMAKETAADQIKVTTMETRISGVESKVDQVYELLQQPRPAPKPAATSRGHARSGVQARHPEPISKILQDGDIVDGKLPVIDHIDDKRRQD